MMTLPLGHLYFLVMDVAAPRPQASSLDLALKFEEVSHKAVQLGAPEASLSECPLWPWTATPQTTPGSSQRTPSVFAASLSLCD